MAKNYEVIEGLLILKEYCKIDGYDICAEHDQLWHGPDIITEIEPNEDGEYPILPVTDKQPITTGHQIRLKELGWFLDSECNRWSCYI